MILYNAHIYSHIQNNKINKLYNTIFDANSIIIDITIAVAIVFFLLS